MTIKEKIAERQKIRAEIGISREGKIRAEDILLLISESIDDYIEHRIRTDKVLQGIFLDIQSNISDIQVLSRDET